MFGNYYKLLFVALFSVGVSTAFSPNASFQSQHCIKSLGSDYRTTSLNGFMDNILKGAFANNEYDDRRAMASHILVPTEEEARTILASLKSQEIKSFEDAAIQFSKCASRDKSGSLGTFEPGKMVQEFDAVCFDVSIPLKTIVGPVKSQFGYHLIRVDDRFLNKERSEGTGIG